MKVTTQTIVAAFGTVAIAPAVWWVATLFAARDGAPESYDYLWQPIAMSTSAKAAIGVSAIALALIRGRAICSNNA